MSIDYAGHVNALIQTNPQITAVAVCEENGAVIYQTENWDISAESRTVLQSWRGKSTFIMLQGVKYSILQCEDERLISTNIKKQGHLVGAITPEHKYVIAYTVPEGNYQITYMDTARAADQMKSGGAVRMGQSGQFTAEDMRLSGTPQLASSGTSASSGPAPDSGYASVKPVEKIGIEPGLKQEIDNFLIWIKNPEGLAAYIDYYVNLNDQGKIAQLAQIYNKFRQIFNF